MVLGSTRRWRSASRRLRINSFAPPEESIYLTYAVKNDKKEETLLLIREYKKLLGKALDYLWNKTRVETESTTVKRGRHKRVKVIIPKKKEVYKGLREGLEEVNPLASHYVDKAISDAFSVLKSWRKRAIKGRVSLGKPRLKRAYVRVKSTLRKVVNDEVRVTVRPHQYLTFSWGKEWFKDRVNGLELGEPVIKEDKVYLPFRYKAPTQTPLDFLAVDSNLSTLDAYDGEKFVTFSLKGLYSLKYSIVKKKGKVQSFASKHGKRGRELLRKYSHRERHRVLDYVHKFVNALLELYPLTTFAVERLDKQSMFKDASGKLSRKISRTVWRSIHKVLKYKAPLYGSRVLEVNPYLTSRSCPRCGYVSRKVGKTFVCQRCGFKLDRQLNASLNIYLKMCGFPHLDGIPSRWVGVTPLMGRRRMKEGPLDSREAQGLRIDIKYEIR
ncbi:IS200/IS605 family element transposase accessory protein TnpB [Metallosphaera tengchongensis]|uniref:IS200/IS605 family element transposase accessory protein TnpB n=1 Tax=Metallosphaera tengchongensis TaxID=1532350 RepID=A0A6N0NTV6_9CREN|nr:RNA-guided endonuclease TnpB family protein [Metallosphaera tengchongensis]QKR00206.1 IS200/IS605 family element transposase accessory protein TnpB [Metallosphaera tengchongensis]